MLSFIYFTGISTANENTTDAAFKVQSHSDDSLDVDDPFDASSDLDPNYSPSDEEKTPFKDEEPKVPTAMPKNKRKAIRKEKVGKKRLRNVKEWIDVKSKAFLNRGLEHLNRKGKPIKARSIAEPCKEKCRLKCKSRISEEHRLVVFKEFWDLLDHTRQWEFIARHVKQADKKQHTVASGQDSRRNYSRQYYFHVGSEQIQICKVMFVNTLGISQTWVNTALRRLTEGGTIQADMRGTHTTRPQKISPRVIESVRNHIKMFPLVPSHYIRKDSKRMYLEEGLSVQKMFRLYIEYADNNNITQRATCRQYRDIFNTEFNIGFFKPKKDQCNVCSVFNLADEFEKTKLLETYERHINNKTLARDLKNADKERAQNDKNLCVACFDLQKVLATPQSNVSDFYYKSKYATYNFTIYDIGRNDGYCYVWHEEVAKRGSNEIASCLWNFLELQKSKGIETVILYSDNCGGQNRNHVVFSMFVYAATKFQIKITHRFFEKGHTQNEGDSMHAVIENAKKRQSVIYVPEQWITLIRMAKTTGKVYNVTEMSQDDFFDFKAVAANQNWKTDTEKNPVQISRIKEINFSHETLRTASFKYDFNSDLKTCDVNKIRRGRPINIANNHPPKLYDSFLPIDGKKLTGLLWLCETGKIPSMYHAFYKNLRSKNSTCSEDKDESVEEEEIE